MLTLLWIMIFLAAFFTLSFQRASLPIWTIAFGLLLLVLSTLTSTHTAWLILYWLIYLAVFVPLNIFPLRRVLLTRFILQIYRKIMPSLSETEKQALTAGTVSWTRELFSGMPKWDRLMQRPKPKLSESEQAFIDGPVEKLCAMINNWQLSQTMTLPKSMMEFIAKSGFFGMIIPKKFGGLEFSALAHSEVLLKIGSFNSGVATVVAVPNSLGPGELLLHYGTEEQKKHYLPRLASGEDIPCFALTSPVAGSDAGAIEDYGIVTRKNDEIYIKLTWNKRYITLAPVATVLGLAFKLYDPDHILGKQEELGITCALIPVTTPGVVHGNRHFPLHSCFPNGPTQGEDVLVPMDAVIGGQAMIGQGWRMLMECLATGRGITLPTMATGGSRMAALASGAYSRMRRQFNAPLADFGGIKQSLAKQGGHAYMINALRLLTVSMIDLGEKPAVASGISKYHATEVGKEIGNAAMDLHGGKGICMGPKNYLAQGYIESPIAITVEGANILTRSMIIFGQGSIRCHPYILAEMNAAQESDPEIRLKKFDREIISHLGYLVSNFSRAFILSLTDGLFSKVPAGPLKRYYQKFNRFSAILGFTADVCMISLGGALKRREKLSARLGDLLSYLYIGTAVLKFYADQGEHSEDESAVVRWICDDVLFKLQIAQDELLYNLPNRFLAGFLRVVTFPLGKRYRQPKDRLTNEVADLLAKPSILRDRLAEGLYLTPTDLNAVGQMHEFLADAIEVEPHYKTINKADRDGKIFGKSFRELVDAALEQGLITEAIHKQIHDVYEKRMQFINVDDFAPEFFKKEKASKE